MSYWVEYNCPDGIIVRVEQAVESGTDGTFRWQPGDLLLTCLSEEDRTVVQPTSTFDVIALDDWWERDLGLAIDQWLRSLKTDREFPSEQGT